MVLHVAVFAHQGGWDEMLFVAIPIVLFVLLLRLANRRADRQAGLAGPAGTDAEAGTGADTSASSSAVDPDTGSTCPAPPVPDPGPAESG